MERDDPDAVMLRVVAGTIVRANDPVEVDNAFPVMKSGAVMSKAREPVEVDVPCEVTGKPGLMASIWNVPGNASKPEYPLKKNNPIVVVRENPRLAMVAVFWIKYPLLLLDVSQ